MSILTNEIKRQKKDVPYLGRVVIGTVEGDIHDIGKSLVVAMLVDNQIHRFYFLVK